MKRLGLLEGPNRFGGMRDSAFFRCDIWDLSSKRGREAGIKITSGSGISCFHGVGIQDLHREQSRIKDFNPPFCVLLKHWSLRCLFFFSIIEFPRQRFGLLMRAKLFAMRLMLLPGQLWATVLRCGKQQAIG